MNSNLTTLSLETLSFDCDPIRPENLFWDFCGSITVNRYSPYRQLIEMKLTDNSLERMFKKHFQIPYCSFAMSSINICPISFN